MSEVTLWIDSRRWEWRADEGCWISHLGTGAEVRFRAPVAREIDYLARLGGSADWLGVTLATQEREWECEGDCWVVQIGRWEVEVMYNDRTASWEALAYGYGEARTHIGQMDLVAALLSVEQWSKTLWSKTIGRWSWDEDAGAYVLALTDALYTLYWGFNDARWWCEIARMDDVQRICTPCTDPRAAVQWVETEVIAYGNDDGTR